MKSIKLILTVAVALSFVLGSGATVNLNKTNVVNENENSVVKLTVNSEAEIYGLQFEINYDTTELTLKEARAALDGYAFHYKEKEDGIVRGLIFSLEGVKLAAANNISDLVEFEFESDEAFDGSSIVEFNEIIIAGQHGKEISASVSPFEVTFENPFIPAKTSLSKNYPNPFNPSTQIPYDINEAGFISLVVYDLNGKEVKSLVSKYQEAGSYNTVWNGLNNSGQLVASGRYLVKMSAPGYTNSITMTLLK